MKLDENLVISVLIQLAVFSGWVRPFLAMSEVPSDQVSTTDIAVPNGIQIGGAINQRPATNNSSTLEQTPGGMNVLNQAESGFQLANVLFPHHFGEFFEVFEFFMERRWHQEIEETIEQVADQIIGEGAEADRSEEEIQKRTSGH